MEFLLSADLVEFNRVVRSFFEQNLAGAVRRSQVGEGAAPKQPLDPAIGTKLRELGAIEAVVPEDLGGLGLGLVAAESLLSESGRALAPLPLFETIALGIVPLLFLGSGTAQSQALSGILGGAWASGAFFEALTGGELCTAETSGQGCLLSGTCRFVPAADRAELLIVPARSKSDPSRICLYSLKLNDGKAAGAAAERLETFDLLRSYFNLTLSGAQAEAVSEKSFAAEQFEPLLDRIQILAAADAIGAAEAAFDLTLEYVKMRRQFDRQIGSFQVLQHRLADMHTEQQKAAALNRFAAWCADNDEGQLPQAAAGAAIFVCDQMPRLIEAAIQIHGGIGFTYEYDLHLYLRRVLTLSRLVTRGSTNDLLLAQSYLPK